MVLVHTLSEWAYKSKHVKIYCIYVVGDSNDASVHVQYQHIVLNVIHIQVITKTVIQDILVESHKIIKSLFWRRLIYIHVFHKYTGMNVLLRHKSCSYL